VNNTELESELIEAAKLGDLATCRTLLRQGADVRAVVGGNIATQAQWSALHYAADHGHADVCRLLLKHGADLNALTEQTRTALHWAAFRGRVEACRVLVESGANLQAMDKNNHKPLHMAVMNGKIDVARYFLDECGEEINQRFNDNTVSNMPLEQLADESDEAEMAAFLAAYRLSLVTDKDIRQSIGDGEETCTPTRSRGLSPI
jgi:ankyrin repeat protein